ncbi:MAG: SoxR reducing system RseC family protein [Thiotrichales bacterium]
MIVEQGVVVDADRDTAWVEMRRGRTCGGCAEQHGCGVAAIDRWLGERGTVLRLRNTIGVNPGDRVTVGLSEGALLHGAALIYAAPILAMLVLAGAVSLWFQPSSEGPVILAGALGFMVALLFVRRRVDERRSDAWTPVLVAREARADTCSTLPGLSSRSAPPSGQPDADSDRYQ